MSTDEAQGIVRRPYLGESSSCAGRTPPLIGPALIANECSPEKR